MTLPTQTENPHGLHQRYSVRKAYGKDDPSAEYFVLRIDNRGDDQHWLRACRDALAVLCDSLDDMEHMPELSGDIRRELERLEIQEPLFKHKRQH